MYVERAKTEIENDLNLIEKSIEFQTCGINLSSFIDFELSYLFFGHFRLRPNAPAPVKSVFDG